MQGTYETFVEIGRQHYGGEPAGQMDSHRRAGRHGRRAAAGGDAWPARRCWPSNASRAASICGCERGYLDEQADDSGRGAGDDRSTLQAARSRSRSGCSAMRPRCLPELVRRGVRARCGDRPDFARTIRSMAICRTAGRRANGSKRAQRDPQGSLSGGASSRWRSMCRRCSPFTQGVPTLRLRQQHPPDGQR